MRWNLFIMQKPRGEERRGGGGRGDISFSRQPGRQDIARSMQPKKNKPNNPSFINNRLKQKQRGIEKKIPNYILWSWCVFLFSFTVLTQLICFSVNPPPTHPHIQTTAPSPSTSPGYLGLIGNIRSYLHFKVLMQHFPQSYYRLTCASTSRIRQSVWAAIFPTSTTPPTYPHLPLSRQVSTLTSVLDCWL